MKKLLFVILFHLAVNGQSESFINYSAFETNEIYAAFTNDGRLWYQSPYPWGGSGSIFWPKENESTIVFQHGLWLTGYQNESLIGVTPFWDANYTPGPMIDGQAAIIASPEDSALYRGYIITSESGPGDLDYDEWPSHWGAPAHEDGTPMLLGDVTMWHVYNDAHPDVHGWIENNSESNANTHLEVRETVWGYNESSFLADVLFFKWQIFNKGDDSLDSMVITHWNDIDLWMALSNMPAYDLEMDFGYMYYDLDSIPADAPMTASYFLLQGPLVLAPSDAFVGYSFGEQKIGYYNLGTSAFWGISDDSNPPQNFGGSPVTLEHVYNFSTGLRHDGSPIVNPVSGDETSFTFTGDPITGGGWQGVSTGGGMAGYMVSTGKFNLAAGDSQEVIFALTASSGDSLAHGISNLKEKIGLIRNYYNQNFASISETKHLPESFIIHPNFPNPFNPTTTLSFELNRDSFLDISIYNLTGQLIDVLDQALYHSGYHEISWNAKDYASGMYIYKISTENASRMGKCILLK